jgi:hypothetical protein
MLCRPQFLKHVDLSFPPTIMREKNIGSYTQNILEKRIKNEGELRDTKDNKKKMELIKRALDTREAKFKII